MELSLGRIRERRAAAPRHGSAGLRARPSPSRAPVLIEAGTLADKSRPEELAKFEACRAWAQTAGGEAWVIAADLVPPRWFRNAIQLHLARLDYRGDPALAAAIRARWERGRASIEDLVREHADHPRPEVVAAARKVMGDLLAEGRLDLDLATVVPTLATMVRARPRDRGILEPPGVVRDPEELVRLAAERGRTDLPEDGEAEPKPDVDPESIEDPEARDEFERRRAAMRAILEGATAAAAARANGLEERRAQQLWNAYDQHGARALVPYATRRASCRTMPPPVVSAIEEVYARPERPSLEAVVDHPAVRQAAIDAGMRRTPSRYQVSKAVGDLLRRDQKAREARAGRKLVPLALSGRAVTAEQVPGLVCEFDEATLDVKVQALSGGRTTVRMHIGVLIDVATRYPLSVVVSPKALDQWDLRRAVIRAMLDDSALRLEHGIREDSPWA